jgi:hypothetical protein
MASGIDDEVTLRANREGFLKVQLRPRRLNDVSKVDMSVELLGTRLDNAIIIAPTGGNKFFHPEGEIAVAKAARAGNHLDILSTSTTSSVEAVSEARGAPIWFQLYASPKWEIAQTIVKRAEAAGCPVLAVTVDRLAGRNQETLFRLQRTDTRECAACHQPGAAARARRRPMYDGIDLSAMRRTHPGAGGRWHSPRHRRRQGARYRRTGRLHRPALFMGVGRVRPARRGTRAGNHARRNARGHAAVRSTRGEGAQPGVRAPGNLSDITLLVGGERVDVDLPSLGPPPKLVQPRQARHRSGAWSILAADPTLVTELVQEFE